MNDLPRCIIVTGRPGSGKTTLSPLLADRLHMPVIGRDAIKEGYVQSHGRGHDDLPDANRVVSQLWSDIVLKHLEGRISVVIEAAFQHELWAPNVERIVHLCRPTMVICTVPVDMAQQRYAARTASWQYFHGSASGGDYEEPHLDMPTIRVLTASGYDPSLDAVVEFILADQ